MSEPSTVSTASADARKDGNTTEVTDDKQIEPMVKKPRFNKSATKRHAGAAYTKEKPVTSLNIVPRRKIFPIFVSNQGVIPLANYVYRAIEGRDFRLARAITELQLAYALTIAYANRVVQISLHHGYSFPEHASRLKQIATGIQLPNVLCQYIESIGEFTLSSTATVVPFSGDYRTLFPADSRLMIGPDEILRLADRPVPEGPWALDPDWIVMYNDSTSRASRTGMKFRPVDNTDFRGRPELIVSYQIQDDMLLPTAPQVITEAEAQLGATYRFRDYDQLEGWFGEHRQLLYNAFVGIPFDPQIVFSDICVAAFKGATVSTD